MDRPVVYLDVVFLINLLMDYAVLWATSRFGQFRTSAGRLGAASLLGAFYSLFIFWPQAGWLASVPGRIAFSVLMVAVAFGRPKARRFLQALSYFYLTAFAAGGAMLGGIYLLNAAEPAVATMSGFLLFLGNVRYTWLLAALAAAILMGRFGAVFIKRNFLKSMLRVPVVIRFGDARLAVQALIDTGNQLQDPLTRRPVMITEYGVLKNLLPPAAQEAFEASAEPDLERVVRALEGSPWGGRVRMIPFTSIGRARGMLLGFRPDEVLVLAEDTPVRIKEIVVGVYQQPLSSQGHYRALLHPDVLRSTMGF